MKRSSSSSPSRRRAQTALFPAQRKSTNFAVIGPNDKFANSQLYRLRQPVENHEPVAKPKEYAILGRNEKFQDNVAYPLRKPIADDPPPVRGDRRRTASIAQGSFRQHDDGNIVKIIRVEFRRFVTRRSGKVRKKSSFRNRTKHLTSISNLVTAAK